MWFVVYDVVGFGPQKVGPWPLAEANEQKQDIEGYAGVSNARLEKAPDGDVACEV